MFISVDLPAPFSPRRACTSPRRTSNEIPSFATTPGNSLRIPRISRTSSSVTRLAMRAGRRRASSSPALRNSLLLFEDRRRLELSGDDLGLEAVHQCDPGRLHLRTHLPDTHAVVLQVQEQVVPAVELTRRRSEDRVVDADVGLLERTRKDPARDLVLVRVDPDAPLAELRGLLERAVTAEAGDLEDHLGALTDLVLRDRRAGGLVSEAVRVPHDRRRPGDGLCSAVLVTRDVRVDRRDLDAARYPDDLLAHALGHLRREHADEAAALLRGVGDSLLVLVSAYGGDGIVGDREIDVRILLGVLLHRVAQQESGSDDEVGSVVDRRVVVRLVVA